MSDAASDQAQADEPFVERDDRETVMPYDKGGVPLYIGIAWVGFIIVYVVVMAMIALPDLRSWMAAH